VVSAETVNTFEHRFCQIRNYCIITKQISMTLETIVVQHLVS